MLQGETKTRSAEKWVPSDDGRSNAGAVWEGPRVQPPEINGAKTVFQLRPVWMAAAECMQTKEQTGRAPDEVRIKNRDTSVKRALQIWLLLRQKRGRSVGRDASERVREKMSKAGYDFQHFQWLAANVAPSAVCAQRGQTSEVRTSDDCIPGRWALFEFTGIRAKHVRVFFVSHAPILRWSLELRLTDFAIETTEIVHAQAVRRSPEMGSVLI